MAIGDEQFKVILDLIEDGELDDRMLELQRAIDDRNSRRKDDILKLVKSVWGDQAQVVAGEASASRAPVEYVPQAGPEISAAADDAMSQWPTPIESTGTGGGDGFSPVKDPMSAGNGSDPFGDGNPDIVSTGAQI